MRPLARAFCATLALLPALACARDYVAESPVSLSLVVHHTGPETAKSLSGNREIIRATHVRRVLTNATILDALFAAEIIPERRGWRLIAVWAAWSENYTGYNFYAQNISHPARVRAVPENILSFETLGGVVARRHTVADSAITAGTETYKINTRLRFGDATFTGELLGLVKGAARYARPRYADAALYVPGNTTFKGVGPLTPVSESGPPAAHVTGTLTLGAATPVPLARYQAGSSGSISTGAVLVMNNLNIGSLDIQSIGSTGLTKTGSGTLTLTGSNTYVGSTTVTGGTLMLGSSGTISAGTATMATGPLALAGSGSIAGGTVFDLGNKATYTLPPGSTLIVTGPALAWFDLLNLPPGATFLDGVLTLRPVSTELIPDTDVAPSATP